MRTVYFAISVLLGLAAIACADSLPIQNGHYSGGPVVLLKLTEAQQKQIKRSYKPYQKISISRAQQARIIKVSKIKESPTKLIVVSPKDTERDCTCGLANIGLIIDSTTIEIPISYLATDKEAKEMEIVD